MGTSSKKSSSIPQLPAHPAVAMMFVTVFDVGFDAAQTKWPLLKLKFPAVLATAIDG